MPRLALASLALASALAACVDSGAERASSQIQEGLAAMEVAEQPQFPQPPQRDSAQEARCRTVTQAQMDSVEARMENMASELVMLDSAGMLALSCSRYQMYLRGEASSY
ncbi:MAG: hypothetical protein PVF27_06060 [Gemmatimonadales bacterium]|jgi:hypothetical protein